MIPRNLMLISVWCGMFSTSLACASSLGLSNDEVRWIESHQIIKYAIDPYWRPIEYKDNKEAAGLTVAYLKEIASNIGVQIQFIETSSWNESITLLAEGKVDLLPGVPDFDIPQSLAAQSQPSPPYFATTTIAVTNAKNRIISGFSDFSIDDTIAIRAGGAYESWIRKKYPNLKIVSFDSTEEALNAVARGQATAVIGPEPILHPVVRQRYSRSLFVAGVIQNLPLVLRMATSTQNPELHSIVQKAISAVSAEQSDRIQEEWVEDADFGQPSITALLRYYGGRIGAIIFVFSATIVALLQAWKARSAISEIAEQRAAFLSIMAHEIRNPLNYILASIELAYAQPDKESARHYIEIAINGSKSLLSLLTTALDYSKISEKNISINKSAATISEILSPILPGFHMEAEKKGVKFEVSVSAYFKKPLLLDVAKVRQILTNIVSNAIKFTDYGSVSLFIEGETNLAAGRIIFRVVDTGIGMPPREIPNITKPFYQIKNQTKDGIGAGLGLAICSAIIDAMHGELLVASSPGQGTVVTVAIPCEQAIGSDIQGEDCATAENNSNARVLVVEDIEINREIIRAQLEHLGYSAVTVGSGREVISTLNQNKFDLVLLDCNLPDISGYDVAKYIRNSSCAEISLIPIVAISADVDVDHVGKCLDSGMDGVISKPISLSKLNETLMMWTKKAGVYMSTTPTLSKIPDSKILVELRKEALQALRSARKRDGNKVESYIHRFRGIALNFGLTEYVNMTNFEIGANRDFRAVCATMIDIIRALTNEIGSNKR